MKINLIFVILITLFFFSSVTTVLANEGCEGIPKTDKEYARKLAEQGDPKAQFVLGTLHSWEITRQRAGLYKDYFDAETQKWFHKAAEQGHVQAQGYLCSRYTYLIRQKPDIPNLKEELQWCYKAAEHNFAPAQLSLARFYWDGEGIPANKVESYFWYKLFGNDTAIPKKVIASLTNDQMTAIEERAKKWKAKFPTAEKRIRGGGSGELHNWIIEEIPLNIAGLVCGGAARDCQIWDTCNDMVGIVCERRGPQYILANKKSKTVIASCLQNQSCKNFIPKKWTCGSPRNMPLSRADQKKHSQYEDVISCGDILGVDSGSGSHGTYQFINKTTGEMLLKCSWGRGRCIPPKEWTCGRPSNYGN